MPCFPLKSFRCRKYEFAFDGFIRQIVSLRLHISFFLNAKLLSPPNETMVVGLPFGTPFCPPECRQKKQIKKKIRKTFRKKMQVDKTKALQDCFIIRQKN